MNVNKSNALTSRKQFKLYLLGLLVGLVTFHLALAIRTGTMQSWTHSDSFGLWSNSVISWSATGFLLWSRRHLIYLNIHKESKVFGSLIIAGMLVASIWWADTEWFLRSFPFLSFLGFSLITSGFAKVSKLWRELLILGFLLPPEAAIEALAVVGNMTTFTVYFATALLQCLGFAAHYQDSQVLLPHGGVFVSPECAGISSMIHLLGLTVLYLILFPTRLLDRYLLLIVPIVIAFVNNSVRVAALAILSASTDSQTFHYWHTGNGSHLNSVISVLLLGLVCLASQFANTLRRNFSKQ